MRLLYFSREYSPHDYRFLDALAGEGVDVFALFLEKRTRPLEVRPLPQGVRLLEWPDGWGLDSPQEAAAVLKTIASSVQPDMVQAGPVQACAYLASLAGLHPLTAVSWGSDLLNEAGASAQMQAVTREALAAADALVGDCSVVANAAVQYGFPPGRIVTFPWGVDLGEYRPAGRSELRSELGWGQNLVFISTRNFEPLLGVDVLARGFALAARSQPDLRLLLLGSGSMEDDIRQILFEAGVLDKVFFTGRAAEPDMPDLYHSADVYVSATHSDGSSVSLMQALACGLPVVVSDIPGNREWITPGLQGWLFRDGSAGDLAAKLLTAASARQDFRQMGASARRLAEERADWSRNFPCLFEAYRIAQREARQ